MKIIDGTNAVLGRLASYAAKEALKGEDIVIVNCEKVIVTGNKVDIKNKFEERVARGGSSQKGPKHSRVSYMFVKRAIRGMLPDHRMGRGRIAFKKIKCHNGVPAELESAEKITLAKSKASKFVKVSEVTKKHGN